MLRFIFLSFWMFITLSALTRCSTIQSDNETSYNKKLDLYTAILKDSSENTEFWDSLAVEFVGTPNFNLRKPEYVIIHHTAQTSCEETKKKFTDPASAVSAHYVICKDGTVTHMLNDYLRAWHAGASTWEGNHDVNSSSIGIELDNNGFEAFPDPQLRSLLTLLSRLQTKYKIPPYNFIGHSDVSTNKTDPNQAFPWKTLANKGFGLWYDDSLKAPLAFDIKASLKLIGYNVSDMNAAIIAFKRHFIQTNIDTSLSRTEKAILHNLAEKALYK